MTDSTVTVPPPFTTVEFSGTDWTITAPEPITDDQAAAITFRAEPKQVTLGAFVAVVDPEGTRIGHLSAATYHERAWAPAYVTASITLR